MHARDANPDNRSDFQSPSSQWIVPFERNAHFTDRNSELGHLENTLFSNKQFAKVAVSGLGGVGKTQLVLELLYRLREKNEQFSAIWIQATTLESLDQGYHTVAQRLGIRGSGGEDANTKKLVQSFLSDDSAGHWVLVFDNTDDVNMWIDKPEPGSQQASTRLIDYIPRNKNGRVIFTTRDRKVSEACPSECDRAAPIDRRYGHTNVTESSHPQGARRF